jgi:hypothetical protein
MSREALAALRGAVAGLLMGHRDDLVITDPIVELETTGSTVVTARGEDGPISRFRVAAVELDLDQNGNEPPGATWFAWGDVEYLLLTHLDLGHRAAERAMQHLTEHREFPCPLDPPTTS